MHTRTIHPVRTTVDGMAGIGRTSHDLRGIRFDENDGGNTPAGTPAAPAAPAATTPPPAATPAPAATPSTPAAPIAGENVTDLPAWAQKIITDARKGEGDQRVAAKTAAEDAQKALTDKLAVALGLKPDAATDPAALTASLTAAQATALNSARELAVYKAAGTTANPDRLLDSTKFLTSIKGIDPTDGPAIKAAIDAAVAADASLKAARAAGASSIDNPGGTGEVGQITEAQLAQMTPEQIAEAYEKGLLKSLL
ncbi:MAG: hypothetical protein JWM23_551 [Microbacteriaceae bacterium]|nr:hypothetical protein [Microbacteriaceae bacterium]